MKSLGLDIGSTTLKCALTDENGNILYTNYQRHRSKIQPLTASMLSEVAKLFPDKEIKVTVSGSAGMGIANQFELPFVQEVYAERIAVGKLSPKTDVVIELGGEDAKILFLTGGFEMRMNGTCAGGTGAFIDQMAALMDVSPEEMNDLAAKREKIYTVASRCGVFAKSDIQPLLNQGARKEDVAASIFYAVVNQTIAGLAQGRAIEGKILYLGGPLTFFGELRKAFDDVLKTEGLCPEKSLSYVALGAAYSDSGKPFDLKQLSEKIEKTSPSGEYNSCSPLFLNEDEFNSFIKRHEKASEGTKELSAPAEEMYLGIDAGSTTIKLIFCDKDGNVFRPYYTPNGGNPIPEVKEYLEKIYGEFPDINIKGAAVTGYGEEIIKNAFHADCGLVETTAHFTAAKHFKPDVDFILDIGGQDIKCFKIHNGVIDNIYLNEACSSGCGSFLQTFAGALGYSTEDFSKLGLFADAPVDLGSRCTVFMNSSVKQAQKDGASVENISAGLSISVVKNALYKVIRCADAESLGKNIVVQGGTFLNNAVLRAFEQEIGRDVIRPKLAAMMGAYGAALYSIKKCENKEKSSLLSAAELKNFVHEVKAITCKGCPNSCRLTLNTFDNGRKYIAGNRCDKPLGASAVKEEYNLYEYKREILNRYRKNERDPSKLTIALPLGLNMYELLPFWHTFFTELGFNVIVSPDSSHKLYVKGQHTIPSDTICYPAKLIHGHIEALAEERPDAIFYPDMSYNIENGLGSNHFNCPVVAYYPQVIKSNVPSISDTVFICDFIGLHDKKTFNDHIKKILDKYFFPIPMKKIKEAAKKAYAAYDAYLDEVRQKAEEYINTAKEKNMPVIVLAGRPYHIDPEICHGIDSLICKLGAVVITEDSLSHKVEKFKTGVMNQWTYHSRLYAAAKYIATAPSDMNIQLVQLVSFGCGLDAVTTDETRSILEEAGKMYTQIKIDEISNMGAVKIRLRSLFSAIETKNRK